MAKFDGPEYENFKKCLKSFVEFKDGICDIVRNEMDKLLNSMCKSIPSNILGCIGCTIRFDQRSGIMISTNNCRYCNSWLNEIRKYQANSKSVKPWEGIQIKGSEWTSNAWELARFFVPQPYAKDMNDNPEACDAAFLLHVMNGCKSIKDSLSQESLVAIDLALQIRNEVMHPAHLKLETKALNILVQNMCTILQDNFFDMHRTLRRKTIDSIQKIQTKKRTNIPIDAYEMLREYMDQRHQHIERILSTEPLLVAQQEDQLRTSENEIESMLQFVAGSKDWQTRCCKTTEKLQDLLSKIRSKIQSDVECVRAFLQDRYRKNFLARVPLDPFEQRTILSTDDIYINLLVTDSKHMSKVVGDDGKPLEYNDIFTTNQGSMMKRVVIEGEPGIGKTTWCHKFAQDWIRECKNEDSILKRFQLLFIIELREVENETTLEELLSSRIFGLDASNKIYVEQALKYIQEHPGNVLIILDGLDEYRRESLVLNKVLKYEEFLNVNFLITSRDWAVPTLEEYTLIDRIARIQGFDQENTVNYIRLFLKSMNPALDDEEITSTTTNLQNDIKRMDAADIMRVPLLLSFVCHIWYMKRDEDLPTLYTQIYTNILDWYHKAYVIKRRDRRLELHKAVTSGKEYYALLMKLGSVAFQGMVAKPKEELIFYSYNVEKDIGEENFRTARDVGLLIDSISLVEKRGGASLTFPHKTIQEYLASYFIASSDSEILQKLMKKCKASQNIGAMENIVIFLCGLNYDMGIELLNHLIKTQLISSTEKIKKQSLLLKCISQMNVEKLRNSGKLFIEHFHFDSPLGARESFGWMYDWATMYNLMALCCFSVKSIKLSHFRMIRHKESMIVRPRYDHVITKSTGNVPTPDESSLIDVQLYPMKEVVALILHGIDMEDCKTWPGLISSLKGLPCLQTLEISWCNFNTAQVEIPACGKLTSLRLDVIMMESNMWPRFIHSLANVQNLQDILFKQTDFEDSTINFPNIGSLQRIELDRVKMKDDNWDIFLPSVTNLKNLKSLKLVVCVLGRSSVTFEKSDYLEHLQLERLQLEETQWPALVESFQNLTSLTSLHMTGIEVCQSAFSLPILHSLKELKLSELTISKEMVSMFFKSLENQKKLKSLTISGCDLTATDAMFPMSDSIEALTLENIENNPESWPNFVLSISNLRRLKDLNINSCVLGNCNIFFPEIGQLQHLVLSSIKLETCAWLLFFSSLVSQRMLHSLKIENIHLHLGDSGFIFPAMPNLKDITVEQLQMDSKQWPSFLDSLIKCDSLEEIEIRQCDFGDSQVILRKFKCLKAINLAGIAMETSRWPNFLESLKNLEDLRRLEISLCNFGDNSPKIPHLETLEMMKILAVVVDASVEKEFDLSLEKYAKSKDAKFIKCVLKDKRIADETSSVTVYHLKLFDDLNFDIGIKVRITIEKTFFCIEKQMPEEVVYQRRIDVPYPVNAPWVQLCCIDIDEYTRNGLVKSMATIERIKLRTFNDTTYGVDENFGQLLLGLQNISAFQNEEGISGTGPDVSLMSMPDEQAKDLLQRLQHYL